MSVKTSIGTIACCLLLLIFALSRADEPKQIDQVNAELNPKQVLDAVKSLGMHADVDWKKSKKKYLIIGESKIEERPAIWRAEYRAYNGSIGRNLSTQQSFRHDISGTGLNEVTVTMTGFDNDSAFKVRITAEIFKPEFKKDTFKLASKLIDTIFDRCPPQVSRAFETGAKASTGPWRVSTGRHEAGYDASLIYCIKPDDWEFQILDRAATK